MKGKRGRGTAAEDKPPILGLIARGGLVRIWMLENVQRKTIEPIIRQTVSKDSILYTDEYNIYDWSSGFYQHKTVNHSLGEYARDEDGDGHFEPGRFLWFTQGVTHNFCHIFRPLLPPRTLDG